MNPEIRVLLVDDSPLVLVLLQRLLASASGIRVVGTAKNGREALGLVRKLDPDVICTDLHMPVMDGLEFTRTLMQTSPKPVLVVSVSVEPGSPNLFSLLEAGAVDVFPKPRVMIEADMAGMAEEFASRIRILAGVHVFRRITEKPSPVPRTARNRASLVAIGASTGGPQALREIFSNLPGSFSLPIVCVQHIIGSFLSELVAWLASSTPLAVKKASQGERPEAGTIYFAPEKSHLEYDSEGRFSLSFGPPFEGHRPSVTAMMVSAARVYGNGCIGVLLSGMGQDGAEGMQAISCAGGMTLAQDEASSVVYGMAKVAAERHCVQHLIPLEQIAPMLMSLEYRRTA